MAEITQPDWAALARARWPRYRITGTGQYSLVCPKTFSVELFCDPNAGRIASMIEHENGCAVLHKRIRIHAPQKNVISRSPADCERD